MDCLICGCPVGWKSIKAYNGKICKRCATKIPSIIPSGDFAWKDADDIKHIIAYANANYEKFCATASYGILHIDSVHSLFCIAKKLNKDGKPKDGNNIFSVYDLSELSLYCKTPHGLRENVVADVEFAFRLERPAISGKTVVKHNAKCQYSRIDKEYVKWDEPSDLLMFKALFDQMLTGVYERVNELLCGELVYTFELEKARALMMLPEDYTEEDLKRARRLMMKVFHPDKALNEDVTREAQIINEAYAILKQNLAKMHSKG